MFESRIIGIGDFNGGLYILDFNETVCFQTEFDNNLSHVLWRRRLGHILQHRMESLMKDINLLSFLNTSESCVESMKEC